MSVFDEKYDNLDNAYINAIKNGTLVGVESPWSTDEFLHAVEVVDRTYRNRPKSIVVELNTYRKYYPIIIDACYRLIGQNQGIIKQLDRLCDTEFDKSNKRWSKEDDELLIDQVCRGNSIFDISSTFGRSPSAIKSRITYLVGVKRLSQSVVGKFIGTINDEEVEGEIKGIVKKEA